jgi:hypothetical protein
MLPPGDQQNLQAKGYSKNVKLSLLAPRVSVAHLLIEPCCKVYAHKAGAGGERGSWRDLDAAVRVIER